ncbi:hypothetical protein J7K41_03480 [Candidatus Micrarchaeota archaeon]|nr:hypothetical protein [Candidatus Micrarchaeota archaeon]
MVNERLMKKIEKEEELPMMTDYAKTLYDQAPLATKYKEIEDLFNKIVDAANKGEMEQSYAYGALMVLGTNCEDLYLNKGSVKALKLAAKIYDKAAGYARYAKYRAHARKASVLMALANNEKVDILERAQYAEESAKAVSTAIEENDGNPISVPFGHKTVLLTDADVGSRYAYAAELYLQSGMKTYEKDVNAAYDLYVNALQDAVRSGHLELAETVFKRMPYAYSFKTLAAIIQDETIPIEIRKSEALIDMFRESAIGILEPSIYAGFDQEKVAKDFLSTLSVTYNSVRDRTLKKELKSIEKEGVQKYSYVKQYMKE